MYIVMGYGRLKMLVHKYNFGGNFGNRGDLELVVGKVGRQNLDLSDVEAVKYTQLIGRFGTVGYLQ